MVVILSGCWFAVLHCQDASLWLLIVRMLFCGCNIVRMLV